MTIDECVTGWARQIDALAAAAIDANAVRLVAAGVAIATVDALTASARLGHLAGRAELRRQIRASLRDRSTGR